MSVSDLILNNDTVSFTTKISKPVLVAVSFAVSAVGVAPSPLPIVPLRCVMYVKYANELDEYLFGTYIHVRISVDTGEKLVNCKYHMYSTCYEIARSLNRY